jgi:non-heme chloroperoxidase
MAMLTLSRRRLAGVAGAGLMAGLMPAVARPARAATAVASRFFVTSDGVRLHYLLAGPTAPRASPHTIVFVPGWTMPAWIWQPQIDFFSRQYRVAALDPRGQGESQIAPTGYTPARRGADIGDLIATLGGGPVLLVGWSLGVLDALAYIHEHGDARIAGLVLIDNSVGEDPPPVPSPRHPGRPPPYPVRMAHFVRSMFHRPPGTAYLDRLTRAALVTPEPISRQLLAYPVPRTYWKEAVYSTAKPVLYVVRPHLAGQAANLARKHPDAETAVFADAGHALFVDDAARFDALMQDFIRARVWPSPAGPGTSREAHR